MIKFLLSDSEQLVCVIEDTIHEKISCKKAFPLNSSILEDIGVYNQNGQEIYWLDNLLDISEDQRKLILTSVREQFFFINIQKIIEVSSPFFPNTWVVEGDNELYTFEMNNPDDFYYYHQQGILIQDSQARFYLLPPLEGLNEKSQKLLLQFI